MNGLFIVIAIVIIAIYLCKRSSIGSEEYSSKRSLAFGYSRYGYPYSYFGSYYQPNGYYGGWSFGDPYGYGSFGYGGKQQNLYCNLGCQKKYCPDGECSEEFGHCEKLCKAYAPYYNYDHGY